MRLNDQFVAHVTSKDATLVALPDADFSGIVRGNGTFGIVLSFLQAGMAQDEMVASLCGRFDVDRDVVARDVEHALTELRSIGAIDD